MSDHPADAGGFTAQEDRSRSSIRTRGSISDDVSLEGSRESEKREPLMRQLLRLHTDGRLDPVPVAGLPDSLPWPNPTRGERAALDLLHVWFGVRMAESIREPMPFAASVLVDAGVVAHLGSASKLLSRFDEHGVIWCVGEMPKLGKGNGTKMWLPGAKPDGPVPPGGWEAQPADEATSDLVPGAVLDPGPVAVEAQDVAPGVAAEPPVEAVDEALVGDAVRAGSADTLDGVAAAPRSADGGMVDAVTVGHGAAAYDAKMTTTPPPSVLLAWALRRVQVGARNDVGAKLAQQAHDNGYSFGQIVSLLGEYGRRVPEGDHPYTARERMRTAESVIKLPRREPWVGVWPVDPPEDVAGRYASR